MNAETPHSLPSGRSILPSVAWEAVRDGMCVEGLTCEKVDLVLLVSFTATLNRIISKARAAEATEDAIEIVHCALKFRRDQLNKVAETQGRKNLIDGLYVAARGGSA
jgi:hypothetical protein